MFLFVEYSSTTSNYLKRSVLSDLTDKMSNIDHVVVAVETQKIDSGCSFGKEFT